LEGADQQEWKPQFPVTQHRAHGTRFGAGLGLQGGLHLGQFLPHFLLRVLSTQTEQSLLTGRGIPLVQVEPSRALWKPPIT